MLEQIGDPFLITLYTDSHIVRGTVLTRQRRMSDILNHPDQPFIVLSDVLMDEWGSREQPVRSGYAQVNLASVLFAVADTPVEPTPELRLAKVREQAFISVPPFKITGHIHLLPERDLREALGELTGGFIPVTEASYWSDTVGEAKQTAIALAFNHSRAQILAPHREVDPWAGLDRTADASTRSGDEMQSPPLTSAPASEAAPGQVNPADDPWRDLRG
jgi:hypothetical protein